jgi:Kef-type K+ transport system membrane component KefB
MKHKVAVALLVALFAALAARASAGRGAGHTDPVASVVLAVAILLAVAKAGGELSVRMGQPAVLGELLAGVVLGNLTLAGFHGFDPVKTDTQVDMLARIGVLLLLFEVGLETTVRQMLKVGPSSALVAVLGVIAPFALGWGVSAWLLPEASPYTPAFLGAALTATSVGITARVLKDLGRSQSSESHIILGAAVIDDVLGLVILAVVVGAIRAAEAGGSVSLARIGIVLGKALSFLVGSIALGVLLIPRIFSAAARLRTRGVLLALGLVFCFVLSWLSSEIGLAPIVGAFAAGLILESGHYTAFASQGERSLEDLIHPISSFLVPIFFVLMGMRTDLRSFAQPGTLGLAAILTIVGIAGKQMCSLGVVGKGVDRLSVGIGMMPRGEVGLIFANIGLALSVDGKTILDEGTFSAIVVMVILTTMVTPPALKWSLGRGGRRSASSRTHPREA